VKDSGEIKEEVLKRYLDIVYDRFAANQYDEETLQQIIALSSKIEQKYSTYRANLDGTLLTDNQLEEIIIESKDSDKLKSTWAASKQIGNLVSQDVIELVKLRNKSAKMLGYKNYFEKSLLLNEQKPEDIEKLFDELDELTRDEFVKVKNEIDSYLSNSLKIEITELRPWHYQERFFQHAPNIFDVNFDKYFEDKDLPEITRNFFNGIGLNIDDILERSDLFEKEGKYQHAYCTDIDRNGDIRVLCNVKNTGRWMSTMLHEFGHAVYDKFISPNLPWELRTHAHIFATEAIAMFFGRLIFNADWLKQTLNLSDSETEVIRKNCENSLKFDQLVFGRWTQVIFRFEKAMYENPDTDLNLLWRNLVEKYQLLKYPEGRNEPDWAAKIHIALYPAYYHNYMLGELLASQLHFYINDKVLKLNEADDKSLYGKSDMGTYLINLFFGYGAFYQWNELIKKATGEYLTPKYYSKQFV